MLFFNAGLDRSLVKDILYKIFAMKIKLLNVFNIVVLSALRPRSSAIDRGTEPLFQKPLKAYGMFASPRWVSNKWGLGWSFSPWTVITFLRSSHVCELTFDADIVSLAHNIKTWSVLICIHFDDCRCPWISFDWQESISDIKAYMLAHILLSTTSDKAQQWQSWLLVLYVVQNPQKHSGATNVSFVLKTSVSDNALILWYDVQDVKQKWKRDFWPTWLAELALWPAIQTLNFAKVPVRHQLLVVNSICLFDATFLCW